MELQKTLIKLQEIVDFFCLKLGYGYSGDFVLTKNKFCINWKHYDGMSIRSGFEGKINQIDSHPLELWEEYKRIEEEKNQKWEEKQKLISSLEKEQTVIDYINLKNNFDVGLTYIHTSYLYPYPYSSFPVSVS